MTCTHHSIRIGVVVVRDAQEGQRESTEEGSVPPYLSRDDQSNLECAGFRWTVLFLVLVLVRGALS